MSEAPSEQSPPTASSAWEPLRAPVFRRLWLVWLVANTCMWMNDVAAAWLMTSLTDSPVMVALVQTAATLPVFLLGLPSGALADIVDRRRYFLLTQFWVAATASVLCLATVSGLITPGLLLALTFLNGIGLAMRWPVYSAIVPELLPRHQMAAALALNGVAMNASRIIGPVVAGALIASAGSVWVFVLNAVLSVLAAVLILGWRSPARASSLPGERFLGALRVGVQYVRQSPRMRTVLLRVFLFFAQSTALLALLPLVAQRAPGGSAATYTLLLASMGAGAITSAVLIPRWRRHHGIESIVRTGSQVQALTMVIAVFSPTLWLTVPVMFISGIAWLTVANSLAVAAQLSLPDWVRARGMSTYQVALMGGSAAGAAIWGKVASLTAVEWSVAIAAACALASSLLLSRARPLTDQAQEDLTPSRNLKAPVPAWDFDAREGPVLSMVEYRIDPSRADEFREVMQETGRRRLSRGALSWALFRDTADPGRFIEYMLDESWLEHLRHFDRLTATDEALRNRRLALHIGEEPPKITRSIAEAAR